MKKYKIVVYVPEAHGDALRTAMADARAGTIGNYSHCTFTVKGIGRSKPEIGADPLIGEIGKLVAIEEERIETLCSVEDLPNVLQAIKKVHPYDEPATDVYPIELVD